MPDDERNPSGEESSRSSPDRDIDEILDHISKDDKLCENCNNFKGIMSPELRISTYAKRAEEGCDFCSIIHKTALIFQDRWDQVDPYTVWMNLSQQQTQEESQEKSQEHGKVTGPLMMCMLLSPPTDGREDLCHGRMNNLEIFTTPGEITNLLPATGEIRGRKRLL
jgi:hypothetical protein